VKRTKGCCYHGYRIVIKYSTATSAIVRGWLFAQSTALPYAAVRVESKVSRIFKYKSVSETHTSDFEYIHFCRAVSLWMMETSLLSWQVLGNIYSTYCCRNSILWITSQQCTIKQWGYKWLTLDTRRLVSRICVSRVSNTPGNLLELFFLLET